jgi:hypothetical protein
VFVRRVRECKVWCGALLAQERDEAARVFGGAEEAAPAQAAATFEPDEELAEVQCCGGAGLT